MAGDLCNGTPRGSYISGRVFNSKMEAQEILDNLSYGLRQGWEIAPVPATLHGNTVRVDEGYFTEVTND